MVGLKPIIGMVIGALVGLAIHKALWIATKGQCST